MRKSWPRPPVKHRECFECHEPHAGQRGKAVKKSECVDCHEEKFKPAANLPKHVDCAKCHQVHVGPGEGPPKCNSCHEPGALKSGGALHVIKEHQVCSDCHGAHDSFDATRENCTKLPREPEETRAEGAGLQRLP
jgi:predicted CXXCH cytochrome family protein